MCCHPHRVLKYLEKRPTNHTQDCTKTTVALMQTLRGLQPTLRNILRQQALQIQVRGLQYMNDDPSAMHVAYVGVQDPAHQQGCVQKLQQFCTAIVDAFADAGLLLSRDER